MTKGTRLLALLASLGIILVIFFLFVRPAYLNWGAGRAEIARPLPGDEIVPNAPTGETRAITIHAPVERVWAWLAQTGQDRGGFYSFDLLENLVGCEMPTDDVLRPEKQIWKVGDKLWMYPKEKAGGVGFATLKVSLPGRALGFGTYFMGTTPGGPEDGSWSFVVEPVGDSTTRLFIRGRGAPGRSLLGTAFDRSIFEPVHFAMERRMMIGLKELAEEGERSHISNHIQVVLWTLTFILWVSSIVLLFRRRDWKRPLGGFVAASALFQILTLMQPPIFLGIILVLLLGLTLWWPEGRADKSLPS